MPSGRKAPGRGAYDGGLGMRYDSYDKNENHLANRRPLAETFDQQSRKDTNLITRCAPEDHSCVLEWLLATYDFEEATVQRIQRALRIDNE